MEKKVKVKHVLWKHLLKVNVVLAMLVLMFVFGVVQVYIETGFQ